MLTLLCGISACPPLTVLSPVLGWRALHDIRNRPNRRGRGMAITGIVIGIVMTLLWGSVALWWNSAVRRPMLDGPEAELRAGFDGDFAAFSQGFEPSTADPAEAERFIQTLRERYGQFRAMVQNTASLTDQPTAVETRDAETMDRRRPWIPYLLIFDSGQVTAEAEFVVWTEGSMRPVLQFGAIVVLDPEHDALAYPASALERWQRRVEEQQVEQQETLDGE